MKIVQDNVERCQIRILVKLEINVKRIFQRQATLITQLYVVVHTL